MRVLLVVPPHALEEHPTPPLSLGYLAANLLSHNVEVEILDLLTSKPSIPKVRRKLEQYRPQVVGITSVTMNFRAAARILKVCKEFDPRIITAIGGPHVSFATEDTFRRAPWIDIVAVGEGDSTVVDLVSALARGTDLGQVAGIAFPSEGKIINNGRRSPVQRLDDLPLPARHLLPLSRYQALGASCSIVSSRGCPFGCIFCSAPMMFGRKVRFRDPRTVVDEIEYCHRELGFERVNIVDDTFTLNHSHTHALCREMIRRNLSVEWNAYSRVDTLDRDTLELMREAGCTFLVFGIESGNQEILNTIKKGITLEKVRNGIKLTSEVGIRSFASFILGLPGETPKTASESLALARELFETYGVQYGFHFLSPLPGTELYEQSEKYGLRTFTGNWSRYNANEPITEATPGSLPTVKAIAADYDRDIELAWAEIAQRAEAGDKASAQAMQVRQSREFVWKILKEDVIEKLPEMEVGGSLQQAQGKLVELLSSKVGAPFDIARQEVGRLLEKGLLRQEFSHGRIVWRWA